MDCPFAHKDKHTFWVYPHGQKPRNPWDTSMTAQVYCNNHIDDGQAPDGPQLRQYFCLGHSNPDDMVTVKADWQNRGISAIVNTEVVPTLDAPVSTKKYYHGCYVPREFPDGDNHFTVGGAGVWNTSADTLNKYCSNYTEAGGVNSARKYICNGHDAATDYYHRNHKSPKDLVFFNGGHSAEILVQKFAIMDERFRELENGLKTTRLEKDVLEKENVRLKLRMDILEKSLTKQEQPVEHVKINEANKFDYIYIIPLLVALFVTLFTNKQNLPLIAPAHLPQITNSAD